MKLHKEVVWFLLPVAALMRQISGTFFKAVVRYLYPILVPLVAAYYHGFSLWLIVGAVTIFLSQILPVTLIGDSLHEHWLNWLWPFALGYIKGVAVIPIAIWLKVAKKCLFVSFIPCFVIGLAIVLSNVSATAEIFEWKFVEALSGFFMAYPACYVIRNGSK